MLGVKYCLSVHMKKHFIMDYQILHYSHGFCQFIVRRDVLENESVLKVMMIVSKHTGY
jgi:hypothetical protein